MTFVDDIKYRWRHGGMLIRLVLVNIAVFLALWASFGVLWMITRDRAAAEELFATRIIDYLVLPSDLKLLLVRPWTLVTTMFMHYDPGHLFWNMVLLWTIGRLYADMLGDRRLLGTYLMGGLCGSLLFVLSHNLMPPPADQHMPTVLGASGAVVSVVIMIAAYRPEMLVNVLLIGPVKLMYFAGVLILLDLIGMGSPDGVAHAAHIGGALYGSAAALSLKRGQDWSLGLVKGLVGIGDFLRGKKRSRLRVEKRPTRRGVMVDADFNAAKKEKQARVDAILDKISRSGYDSLSKEDRDFLFHASKD
jgi:membrane associated rhomboid family serine protease